MHNQEVQRVRRAVLVVAFGVAACLHAGEKVELKGSTEVELPKPKRIFEESRKYKLETGASELEGGFVPPPSIHNAPVDRKLREMLDRRRNWIYENPYETRMDSRTSEILEVDKNSNPLDHRLLQEEEKGMMQRFLEEKNGRTENTSENSTSAFENRDNAGPADAPGNARGLEDDALEREERGGPGPSGGADRVTFSRPAILNNGMTDFERRMGRSPLEGTIFDTGRPVVSMFEKEERKLEQEAREAEFNKLVQPRGIATLPTLGGGRLDPLNGSADGTRKEVNPSAPRRSDQFLGNGTRLEFSGVNRASGVSAGLPGSSFDFGSSASAAAQQSSFLPGAAPSASGQSPTPSQRPFVLEFPRRKF